MEKLAIGLILKSFGVKGYVKVKSFSGETEHFFRLKKVYVGKRNRLETFKVEALAQKRNSIIIKLEGVDSPAEAKLLTNLEIWVPRKYASPLQEGEYYIADICQCSILLNDEVVGKIKSICEGGVADLLEITHKSGKHYFVPLSEKFVRHVDIDAKKVYLHEDFIFI